MSKSTQFIAFAVIMTSFCIRCEKNEPLTLSICSLDSTVLTGMWRRLDTTSHPPDTSYLDFTCSAKWFIYHIVNGLPAFSCEGDYQVDSNRVLIHMTAIDSGSGVTCDSASSAVVFSFSLSQDSLTFRVKSDSCNIRTLFTPWSWIKYR
jgi:hypothetical protein